MCVLVGFTLCVAVALRAKTNLLPSICDVMLTSQSSHITSHFFNKDMRVANDQASKQTTYARERREQMQSKKIQVHRSKVS